jgi:hypothetical protein
MLYLSVCVGACVIIVLMRGNATCGKHFQILTGSSPITNFTLMAHIPTGS